MLPLDALGEMSFLPLLASGGCVHYLACDSITSVSGPVDTLCFLQKSVKSTSALFK